MGEGKGRSSRVFTRSRAGWPPLQSNGPARSAHCCSVPHRVLWTVVNRHAQTDRGEYRHRAPAPQNRAGGCLIPSRPGRDAHATLRLVSPRACAGVRWLSHSVMSLCLHVASVGRAAFRRFSNLISAPLVTSMTDQNGVQETGSFQQSGNVLFCRAMFFLYTYLLARVRIARISLTIESATRTGPAAELLRGSEPADRVLVVNTMPQP